MELVCQYDLSIFFCFFDEMVILSSINYALDVFLNFANFQLSVPRPHGIHQELLDEVLYLQIPPKPDMLTESLKIIIDLLSVFPDAVQPEHFI